MQNHEGSTALMLAANRGHVDALSLLLDDPLIRINTQNNHGYNAIMFASEQGHSESVELLLDDVGININRTNHDHMTVKKLFFC